MKISNHTEYSKFAPSVEFQGPSNNERARLTVFLDNVIKLTD